MKSYISLKSVKFEVYVNKYMQGLDVQHRQWDGLALLMLCCTCARIDLLCHQSKLLFFILSAI